MGHEEYRKWFVEYHEKICELAKERESACVVGDKGRVREIIGEIYGLMFDARLKMNEVCRVVDGEVSAENERRAEVLRRKTGVTLDNLGELMEAMDWEK